MTETPVYISLLHLSNVSKAREVLKNMREFSHFNRPVKTVHLLLMFELETAASL